MRRHVKASSVHSNQRQATGLGLFAIVFAAVLAASALLAIPASAAKTRAFQEIFGSSVQPEFSGALGLAVGQSTGDVLVMESGSSSIKRFKPNGEADPFSALGSNAIDGKGGADLTPQNGLNFYSATENQVAVDNSGTATDGDIYVTEGYPNLIDIFDETGTYLGQLTGFAEACGVTVDPSGDVYVGDYGAIVKKFVPAVNPVVNADEVAFSAEVNTPCPLAAGAGPSAGYLFAATWNGSITKVDDTTGEAKYTFGSSTTTLSVDPETGHVLQASGSQVNEFDANGSGSATLAATMPLQGSAQGVAANGAGEEIFTDRANGNNVEVFGGPIITLPEAVTSAASGITSHKAVLNGTVNPEGIELTECFFEWGASTAYGETVPCAESPAEIGSGTSPVAVHAEITGLTANGTNYHFRLAAANPEGSANGLDQTLSTAYNVETNEVSESTGTKATLNGSVNPEGVELEECFFEWGTSGSYGETVPCAESPAEIGNGTESVEVHAAISGLQPNEKFYAYRLVAVSGGEAGNGFNRYFYTPVTVTTEGSEGLAASEEKIEGSINPDGIGVTACEFEYGPTSSYGESVPCAQSPGTIGTGSAPVEVDATISGLTGGSNYHYRLKTAYTGEAAEIIGHDATFFTLGPIIVKEFVNAVTSETAKVNGEINPQEELTTYHVEYVDQADFEANGFENASITPVPDAPVGAGSVGVPVSVTITGLQPETTYHIRIAATSPAGTTYGAGSKVRTFGPQASFGACPNEALRYGAGANLPDCRAYEQASEIEKNGANTQATYNATRAGINGAAVSWWTPGGAPGGVGSMQLPTYTSLRDGESWSTHGTLPPAAKGQNGGVLGSTEDMRETFNWAANYQEQGSELFAQNTDTGEVQTIVPLKKFELGEPRWHYVGASEDGSKVFFEAEIPLTPEAPSGAFNVYVWDRESGTVSLDGVLPDSACGSPPCAPAGGSFAGTYDTVLAYPPGTPSRAGYAQLLHTHSVSTDGSMSYFTAGGTGQLYVRKDPTSPGATTAQVSASKKTNGTGPGGTDGNGPRPAAFQFATPDGSTAFFTSQEELTNDATTGVSTIGRANLDGTGAQQNLLPAGSVAGMAVDGAHIYWAEPGANAIGRANLDGSGVNQNFITGADHPQGVAVDGEHVYWTNAKGGEDGEGTIGRANLDGTGANQSFIAGASNPFAVAVNSEHIYWSNRGSGTRAIARAKIDGTEVEQSFVAVGEAGNPAGIAIDSTYIYYVKPGTNNWMGRVKLDGTENTPYFCYTYSGSGTPTRLAVDSGHLYWSNQSDNSIGRAKIDGTEQEPEFITGATVPTGIAVDGGHVYWGNEAGDTGNDLYRFEAGSGNLTDLTPDAADSRGAEVQGVLGTSNDGSHVYFVANGDLDGVGPATTGSCVFSGQEWTGECNLYLWNAGVTTFVSKLHPQGSLDYNSDAADWSQIGVAGGGGTVLNTGRVSADGEVVVFRSQKQLSEYENHEVPEFYRWDAHTGALDCVTCNPSQVAPVSKPETAAKTSFFGLGSFSMYTTRNLSASGNQFFFETPDSLLPADINGVKDVYEWEADGAGSCESAAQDGGCLYLISTGKSAEQSNFADASASGDEVYFFTDSKLVGQDEDGQVDVYAAKVDGGLASQNPQHTPSCTGEACRTASSKAPETQGAGSAVFSGPGNQPAGGVCAAAKRIKKLNQKAVTYRRKSRALVRRARHSHDALKARVMKRRAHHLAKGAHTLFKRAHGLSRRCTGVGAGGNG